MIGHAGGRDHYRRAVVNEEQTGARDPAMSSTKNGIAWHFGMKAHDGVDVDNGTIHSLEATTAEVHDSPVWDELLYGDETAV
ncbi:transposase [Rhodobacterales bacterium HKCCSP123]|nr:transposase [Rhodobacterales bacterium HKCCSP123]